MNKHVTKLSTELSEAREKLRRAESRSGTSSDEEDNNKDKRERPSEDVVERMEEKLEAAQSDQKNLFLIIFQVETFLFVQDKLHIFFCYTTQNFQRLHLAHTWDSHCFIVLIWFFLTHTAVYNDSF